MVMEACKGLRILFHKQQNWSGRNRTSYCRGEIIKKDFCDSFISKLSKIINVKFKEDNHWLNGTFYNDAFSSEEKDLYDILYLMESTEEEDFDITPYVFTYEGIGLLPSFRSPENIAGIREEQWEKLFACIERQGYSLVVLVEQLLQGSGELLSDFNDVILLGRTEDYFLPMQQRCLDLLNGMMQPPSIREVKLNMSANGLVEGTYSLKHLMEGNLGSFVRNEFKGTIASANP